MHQKNSYKSADLLFAAKITQQSTNCSPVLLFGHYCWYWAFITVTFPKMCGTLDNNKITVCTKFQKYWSYFCDTHIYEQLNTALMSTKICNGFGSSLLIGK